MKLIKDKIITLLSEKEMYRENDNKLIARIWYNELTSFGLQNTTAVGFLELLAEGRLSSPESIRRSRQKVQEEIPSLRGSNYKIRQAKSEEVQAELGYGHSSTSETP